MCSAVLLVVAGCSGGVSGEPVITIEAADTTPVTEGMALRFTLTASRAPGADLTVSITLHESGAMLAESAPREVTIAAGSTTASLAVETVGDKQHEPNSIVTATVTGGTGYTVGTRAAAEVEVHDDDGPRSAPAVTITAVESAPPGGTAEFAVLAQPAPAADLTVNVRVTVTPAPSPGATGVELRTVTIRAGESTATLAVTAPGGSTVSAMLEAGMGYTVGTSSAATATISGSAVASPPPRVRPTVTITGDTAVEGEHLDFALTATPAPRTDLRVEVTLSETGNVLTDQTATGFVEAGATTGTLRVNTADDQEDEPNSTVTATLKSSAAYLVGDPDFATGVVADNDDPASESKPLVTILAVTDEVSSGDPVQFTVTADPAPPGNLVVQIDWEDLGNHLAESPPASVTVSSGAATLTAATVTIGLATHRTVIAKLFSDDAYQSRYPERGRRYHNRLAARGGTRRCDAGCDRDRLARSRTTGTPARPPPWTTPPRPWSWAAAFHVAEGGCASPRGWYRLRFIEEMRMTASPTDLATLRQKLLVLYAANSSPDTDVVAWSLYDGASDHTYEATGEAVPPYATVLDAMRDGWRVIKYPDLRPPGPGQEYDLSYLEFEFVLEKLESINGA